MKNYILSTTLLFLFVNSKTYSQSILNLTDGEQFVTNSALIYDQGGFNGNLVNQNLTSTIKAQSGFIRLFFTYIEIPADASLKIYLGTDTSQLIGIFDGTNKPMNYTGKAFTISYSPGTNFSGERGWEGIVESTIHNLNEKVTLPESDCVGAIPLCNNSTVNTSANQYEDTGLIDDDSGSCYSGTGSGGSVWYTFTPQANGNIDFMIAPAGTTDYDFVLWDITNGCENRVQMSCNFSGTTGSTGLNNSGVTDSQDASGTTNNQLESVVTTGVYAICINYYSGNNDGFLLNFQNVAGTVAVTDVTPPTVTNAYSTNCASSTEFTVNFSEYIDCTTLNASDFAIPGYTITILDDNCSGGKTTSVLIGVSPSMPPGSYNLTVNNMDDLCGNTMNSNYTINTTAVPTANAGPDAVACSTPGFFGTTNYATVTLTGSGGSAYSWSTGQTTASISVTPTATTTYILTAIQGACGATDQVTVNVSASPAPALGPDQTICSGFPVTLTASGGVSYQWQSTTTTLFGSPNNWTNIPGATSASYTGTPGTTTYYRVLVTNAAGCTGSDWIKVTIGAGAFGITAPPFICEGQSATLSLPGSMTDYTWSVGGLPVGTANTSLVVNPATTTVYTATSTTAGCTGSANYTLPVHPAMTLTTNANPTNACAGVPVDLSSTGPVTSSSTDTENFEGGTQTFSLVNGSYNKWYQGTAGTCSGTKALYIGTAATNNNYAVVSGFTSYAATNHAYKNYTVTSYCNATLSFNWKNNGNANAYLKVWLVPTSVTPVAGTELTASATQIALGGPYTDGLSCSNVSIDLSPYAGQTVRIVFTWKNTGGLFAPAAENTAALIDDIVFTETSTYNYSWTSSPAGFSASTVNATDNPTSATTYNLTVTRCDGCPVLSSVSIDDCTPLPIELYTFTGENDRDANKLYWITASENNNDYFTLERSSDGSTWNVISIQNGAGNSTQQLEYKYDDFYFETNSINYYRLNQTDFDGQTKAMGQIVEINNQFDDQNIIKITNILGQEVGSDQKGLLIYLYENGEIVKIFK